MFMVLMHISDRFMETALWQGLPKKVRMAAAVAAAAAACACVWGRGS